MPARSVDAGRHRQPLAVVAQGQIHNIVAPAVEVVDDYRQLIAQVIFDEPWFSSRLLRPLILCKVDRQERYVVDPIPAVRARIDKD